MDNWNFSKKHRQMSRQMGRRKTTTKIDYLTATPAIIVADAVAKLSFFAEMASIEEESESFTDANSDCNDDSRSWVEA